MDEIFYFIFVKITLNIFFPFHSRFMSIFDKKLNFAFKDGGSPRKKEYLWLSKVFPFQINLVVSWIYLAGLSLDPLYIDFWFYVLKFFYIAAIRRPLLTVRLLNSLLKWCSWIIYLKRNVMVNKCIYQGNCYYQSF